MWKRGVVSLYFQPMYSTNKQSYIRIPKRFAEKRKRERNSFPSVTAENMILFFVAVHYRKYFFKQIYFFTSGCVAVDRHTYWQTDRSWGQTDGGALGVLGRVKRWRQFSRNSETNIQYISHQWLDSQQQSIWQAGSHLGQISVHNIICGTSESDRLVNQNKPHPPSVANY